MIRKLEELDFKENKNNTAQFVDFVLLNGMKTFNEE